MSDFGKIFVIDSNLFLAKRLSEVLTQRGFEAVHCSDPVYALTMIEWNMPLAILCSTNLQNANAFEVPNILRADAKTSHIPVIAIGDRGQESQLEALRAGYTDFLDRRLGSEEMVNHLLSFLVSRCNGFQPTQMLAHAETDLHGRFSLVDLPVVIQTLGQSRQTGALHINADEVDGIVFFHQGEVLHAECGQHAGDDAIVQMIKRCHGVKEGVYKFVSGGPAGLRTVQGSLNGLILDALRELDEENNRAAQSTAAEAESQQDSTTPLWNLPEIPYWESPETQEQELTQEFALQLD